MLIAEPIPIPSHQIHNSISVKIARYVPTMKVMNKVAVRHPRNSFTRLLLRFQFPIFHATKLATRFAMEPSVMSAMILGMGLTVFEMMQPMVTPITVGHPYVMERGMRASATLTCTS